MGGAGWHKQKKGHNFWAGVERIAKNNSGRGGERLSGHAGGPSVKEK